MYDKTMPFQALRDTVIPLRVAIPLVLFSTAIVVGFISTLYFSHWTQRNQERVLQKGTTALAMRMQQRLEYVLLQGDEVEVQRNLQALDNDPYVKVAWLADNQDRIVAAMPQSLLGELAAPRYAEYAKPLPSAQVEALLEQVRETLTGYTRITDDGTRLLTFYPVAWPHVAGEPRSPRTGVLFLSSDLTQLKREAVNFVLGQAVVMTVVLFCAAGLIGLYLHFVVTRRIERLVEVSQALGQGDEQIRTQFKGKDELSQFGAAFDAMIDTIQARSAQASAALQNSHQQLLDAITYAPLSIALFDRQMGYLATSQIWMREFGRGYADVIGRSHYDIHPDLPDAWKIIHQRGLAGETLKNDEDLWTQADGTQYWLRWAVAPWRDRHGEIGGIIISSENITDRKVAERKLAESEALWRTVIQSEPACVKLIDAQGRLMEMNPAGLAMIESESRDQVIGRDVKWLVAPEHCDAFERLNHRVMAGESGSLVFDIVGIKGTHRTLETHAAPLRDASGVVIALLGVTHDVTDRQRTARALEESEARYRAIFQGSGVSLWEKDFSALQTDVMRLQIEHGEGLRDWFDAHPGELLALMRRVSIVDVNRASLDLFSAKTKDELVSGLSRIFIPESLPLFRDELLALASGARGFTAEAEVGTLNNAHLTVLVTLTAVEMARPWERILVSMLDVTEIKQYRVQLEALVTQRTAQLQSAYKEMESFSYSISHDLRAPLRSISGFGQALQDEYGSQLDDTAQNYISRIQRGALRMGELIEALLRLSRVTRLDIHSKPLDLSKMANQVVESLRNSEPQRSVDVNIAPGLMAVGDETLIYTVLENLLNNAWKYSSRIEHARIDFRQEQCNAERVFCVADNGAGFDMKYATKLFSPFQRMHTTAEFPGTGIGLATVERIIRRHGGRIWVEAEIVRGAQFYFTLPPKESTVTTA